MKKLIHIYSIVFYALTFFLSTVSFAALFDASSGELPRGLCEIHLVNTSGKLVRGQGTIAENMLITTAELVVDNTIQAVYCSNDVKIPLPDLSSPVVHPKYLDSINGYNIAYIKLKNTYESDISLSHGNFLEPFQQHQLNRHLRWVRFSAAESGEHFLLFEIDELLYDIFQYNIAKDKITGSSFKKLTKSNEKTQLYAKGTEAVTPSDFGGAALSFSSVITEGNKIKYQLSLAGIISSNSTINNATVFQHVTAHLGFLNKTDIIKPTRIRGQFTGFNDDTYNKQASTKAHQRIDINSIFSEITTHWASDPNYIAKISMSQHEFVKVYDFVKLNRCRPKEQYLNEDLFICQNKYILILYKN